MTDLEAARAKRWGYTGRKITTIARAAAWIDDLGFALLFPRERVDLPALWVVGRDPDAAYHDWGADEARVWGWKDLLPEQGRAWYGHFLRGRKSFLSPRMLGDLYPRAGRPDDYRDVELSREARSIADVILTSGPTSAAVLREATGLLGKRWASAFSKAVESLGRALVVTHHGVEEQGAGWPSAVLELTARAFAIPRERDRRRAAATFLDTVLATKPVELARAFGWTTEEAREALAALEVEREGPVFLSPRLSRPARGSPRPRPRTPARPRRS